MKRILVLCNHFEGDETLSRDAAYDEIIKINPTPPQKNLELHLYNITHRILGEFNPLGQDLLEIAAYVYYADRSVKRGGETDLYGEKWKRNFEFVIPVSEPELWNNTEIGNLLKESLEFLTDDRFTFTFMPPKPIPIQPHFPEVLHPFERSDCICLFSGGLDSLIGSLFLLNELNERPILVSHRSTPLMDSRQKYLAGLLQKRNMGWQFPHLNIWISRKGQRAVEETQRSRSFLFLAIAAAVANKLNINKIYICENGVISLNIPLSGQTVGAYLTRSTNPKFLNLFELLIKTLFKCDIIVRNPFIFMTKTQMIKKLRDWNQGELIQATVSCAYTQGKTKMQPQCGTCSQCLNRRFSVIAAGMEEHDANDTYEKDVFISPLKEGRETAYAEGYIRTAFEISEMNDYQLFSRYPELEEIVSCLDESAEESGQKIYDLFQQHSEETTKITIDMCNRYQRDLLSGKLPDNCLISMLAYRHHLLKPIKVYAEKISRILNRSIRIVFQTEKPDKEARFQEATQAVLVAAGERLNRESPMLNYSIVRTIPDFSGGYDYERNLFVELKLANSRPRLNQIVKEITSRILIYREQGAYVLFVVYDTNDIIVDDQKFIEDFEKYEHIKITVIR